jgi:hypothetical protein
VVTVTASEQYAAGLAPEGLGGGLETRSLKLKSADGREFAFRPVDKDPSEALVLPYRGTVVDRLVQGATSAANPAAPVIAAALLDAVGVLNARPQLWVEEAAPRTGELRSEYSSVLGLAWNAQELDRRLLAFWSIGCLPAAVFSHWRTSAGSGPRGRSRAKFTRLVAAASGWRSSRSGIP